MPEGLEGTGNRDQARLDPQEFLRIVEKAAKSGLIVDEVIIRRTISAIYFALFNYWAEKRYGEGVRGAGIYGDAFSYTDFHIDMVSKGLEKEMFILYLYRVAVDHYTLNPTYVTLTSSPWKGLPPMKVSIDMERLREAIDAAKKVLAIIKKDT
ncbi:MAG: hypothetical protein LM583_02745 [Desulfurococcaceae archaeon]|nr:hypothetical protein [Desulfurococcaceae archaeon]MCC6055575.1 hypothetical protein [Desulfurococcaceae archaeon]